MTLTWYGHSCFLLDSAEGSAVFDPYSPGSVPGLTMPPLRADAVICSHGHSDHNYAAGVTLSGRAAKFALRRFNTWHDDARGAKRGENVMTLLEAEGLRVLHMGDLGHMLGAQTLAEIGKIDVLLIPVGGFYTIDAAQAAELAGKIAPKICVPMHYRGAGFGYDVTGTVDEFLRLTGGDIRRLDGSSFDTAEFASPVTLVPRLPRG